MSLKRIVTIDDLEILHANFVEFAKTNDINHFGGIKFDPDILFLAFQNTNLLVNSNVVVANFVDDTTIDALCWFAIGPDFRVNKTIATSYMWVSKTHKNGVRVFNEALRILKAKKIKIINVGVLSCSPYKETIFKMLTKKGFQPEDESYSLILEE
jgi:hypothetical protein